MIRPKEYSSFSQSRMLNVVSAAAVFNRVPTSASNLKVTFPKFRAKDLPITAFLPSSDDIQIIKKDHMVLIKRILVKSLPCFARLESRQVWNIPHEYSEHAKKKSETVLFCTLFNI
jgi:hypothetical protein